MTIVEARLAEMGYSLPEPPEPIGNYVSASRSGSIMWMAGVGSRRADGSRISGKLGAGLTLEHSAPATQSLLDDLRSDDGMGWVPESAWLTKLAVDSSAGDLTYDLAIDASGRNAPSPVAAGLVPVPGNGFPETVTLAVLAALILVLMTAVVARRRVSVAN